MRKTGRILACILAVLMLFSALVMSVSASSDAKNQLAINDSESGIHVSTYGGKMNASDFEDGEAFKHFGTDNILRVVSSKYGNKYLSIWRGTNDAALEASSDQPYWHIFGNYATGEDADAQGFFYNDYFVVDFDFGTDSYAITKEQIFGEAFDDLERGTGGYAVYKVGNSAGVEAGTYYYIDGAMAFYDEIMIFGEDITADADGYAVYVEGNSANVEAGTFVMANGEKLKLADLNGFDFAAANTYSGKGFIEPRANNEINIYSSKSGGSIYVSCRFFNDNNDYVKGTVINIGQYGEISGDNLKITCSDFYFTGSTGENGETDAENTLNIIGGTYNANMFLRSRGKWKLNVDGVKARLRASVTDDHTNSNCYVKADVKNSIIILIDGNDKIAPIISAKYDLSHEESYLAFEGCTIYGSITDEYVGKITFKETLISTNNASLEAFKLHENAALGTFVPSVHTGTVSFYVAEVSATNDGYEFYEGKVEENLSYSYYVTNTELPQISGMQLNIATNNGFWINLYIPTSLGYTVNGGNLMGNVTVGEIEYAVYSQTAIAPSDVSAATFDVIFTVNKIACYKTVGASLLDYFNAIINGENYNTYEKALAVNALNYCNEVYNYVNGEYNPDYTAILDVAENKALIDTAVVETPTFDLVDTTVITSAQFIVSDGNTAKFAFGNAGSEETLYAFFVGYDGKEKQAYLEDIGDYYVIHEMSVYDMVATLTIKTEDGRTVAVYNIAEYLNTEEPDKVGVALYGYAKAAIAYQDYKKTLNQ